jgi:hypothetical protein
MKTSTVAVAWSRCRDALRRWLRLTWMGRLPLSGPRPWHQRMRRSRRRSGEPPTIFRPSLEVLERRWTSDDILSGASAPLSVGGLVLLAGSHITPMRLLLNGAPPASDAPPPPQPDTSASPYRYTDADDPLFTGSVFDGMDFVAAVGQTPPDNGLDLVHNSPSALANPDEPATINEDTGDFVDPMAAAAHAAKPLTPTSPPPTHAGTDSPAKFGSGGGGAGGRSTPNAGMGGGGPTGGGGANLHLPGLTSLQRFLPGADAMTSANAATPVATAAVPNAGNVVGTPAASPDNPEAIQRSSASSAPSGTVTSPSPPVPPTGNSGNITAPVNSNTAALQSSTLSLRSSASSAVSGQLVTFTVTVDSSVTNQKPTGTVVFSDGQTLGNASLKNGTATFSTSNLPVGSYMIRAAYEGDKHFRSSANTQSQTVQPDGSAITLGSRITPASQLGVTFTATVNALAPGSGTPTGIVEFKDGSIDLGQASLNEGVATLAASGLLVSSGGVTAFYDGDSQFRGSQGWIAPNLPPPPASSSSGPSPVAPPSSVSGNSLTLANVGTSSSSSGSGQVLANTTDSAHNPSVEGG